MATPISPKVTDYCPSGFAGLCGSALTLPWSGGPCCLVTKSGLTLLQPHGACQAPLSVGFVREVYWRGLPFPTPGDLPNPGIESASLAIVGRFFSTEPLWKPRWALPKSFSYFPDFCSLHLIERLAQRNFEVPSG